MTKLMAFFELNAMERPDLLYQDVPVYYTFGNNKWVLRFILCTLLCRCFVFKRKRTSGHTTLGRIYTVNRNDVERFHLRLL